MDIGENNMLNFEQRNDIIGALNDCYDSIKDNYEFSISKYDFMERVNELSKQYKRGSR